jgi:hypothetical protein
MDGSCAGISLGLCTFYDATTTEVLLIVAPLPDKPLDAPPLLSTNRITMMMMMI